MQSSTVTATDYPQGVDPTVLRHVDRTIARLKTGEVDVAEECDLIWAAARDGEHELLFLLGRELEFSDTMRQSPLGQIGAVWSLVSELEQAILSIPGDESVETLFHFANLEQQNSLTHAPGMVDRRRYFASRLVLNQPRPALLQVMERHEDDAEYQQLLYLLVHELVIQGLRREAPILERLHQRMGEIGHPLAWLPLHQVEIESLKADPRKTRTIHQYKVYSTRVPPPWGPHVASGGAASGGAEPVRSQVQQRKSWNITKGDDLIRLSAAVQNWKAESNGKWEGRVFALHPALRPDELAKRHVLRLHSLEALDLPGGPRDFEMKRSSAEEALAILFRAAANGGELNEGSFGAYGRLYAWRSLGGLVGAPDHASIEDVQSLAKETTFFFFSASSKWFFGLGEEFGLLALRPGGRTLAILAATDSD